MFATEETLAALVAANSALTSAIGALTTALGVDTTAEGTETTALGANTSALGLNTAAGTAPVASAAVTPSDATDLTGTKYLYIGGDGNLVVKFKNDSAATTFAVTAGQMVWGNFARVMAATTATGIVAVS
jgi:hypothetical protein